MLLKEKLIILKYKYIIQLTALAILYIINWFKG